MRTGYEAIREANNRIYMGNLFGGAGRFNDIRDEIFVNNITDEEYEWDELIEYEEDYIRSEMGMDVENMTEDDMVDALEMLSTGRIYHLLSEE